MFDSRKDFFITLSYLVFSLISTWLSFSFPSNAVADTSLSRVGKLAKKLPVLMGSGVGVVVGLVRVVTAYDQFVRSHQLTAWRTPEMAKVSMCLKFCCLVGYLFWFPAFI